MILWWVEEEGTYRRELEALKPSGDDGIKPLSLPPIKPLKADVAHKSQRDTK